MARKMTQAQKDAARIKRAETMRKKKLQKIIDNKKWSLEEGRRRCHESNIIEPPPHRLLKPGDRVDVGNLEWNKVLEVHDGGRYVKLLTVTPNVSHGTRIGTEFRIWYVKWVDCLPYRGHAERQAPKRLAENDDLRFEYSQRAIDSLLNLYYGSGIDLNPDYQRGNAWGLEKKIMLIASIFRNIDIGKFTIIRRPFVKKLDNYYEMLDGKQRLTALIEFYEDRFEYGGKLFSELHWLDRLHFKSYAISWGESKPLTDEQKYRYFLKLNTTGSPVDEKHIEKVKHMLSSITADEKTM